MVKIAPAVAQAAAESGVALRPVADLDAYREKLQSFAYASGRSCGRSSAPRRWPTRKRVAYAEGEEERMLRAVQVVVDENLARPTLIGRPASSPSASSASACACAKAPTTTSSTSTRTTATATSGRPTTA
jgi:hypothetical protein